ncbi:MAG: metal ABC transporter substrate-binding protein [Chloroflexota bacterium]
MWYTNIDNNCPEITLNSSKPEDINEDHHKNEHNEEGHDEEGHGELPGIEPANLSNGEQLQVIASTSIVADIVAQVGGNRIELTGLIPTGADSHSFEASPQDLIALNDAHVIFINGLHLEEALDPILDSLDGGNPIVSVNVGVETIGLGQDGHSAQVHVDKDHAHEGVDPHTWFSIHAVEQWVTNIEHVLSDLDRVNAEIFEENAQAYLAELKILEEELDGMIAELPVEKRILITDHAVLGYFAAEYEFKVVGTVIPSFSTIAVPSTRELAALQDQIKAEGVTAIFVGFSANPAMIEQIANDMGIQVVPIYTESLSNADGPAASYLEFIRYNAAVVVAALK